MALRALVKPELTQKVTRNTSVSQLYRSIIKELPRVMIIYDVDVPLKEARNAVAYHFRKNGKIQDSRVINILVAKGYMELEETLMQWKQKTHLMRVLEPAELRPTYVPFKESYEENNFRIL